MFSLKSEIAVIGAGRASYSLVSALVKSGLKVSSIISKRTSSAKALASKFKIKNYSSDFESILPDAKIFFLTVPDNQILSVAKKLSELNLDFRNSLFVHLSGAEDASVLKILQKKKAVVASFHIMQSFPSKKIVEISNAFAAIETKNKIAEKFLFLLAKRLKLRPFILNAKGKIFYHLAGVYASNFMVGNLFSSEELFRKTGDKKINPAELFWPIINTTLKNVEKNGTSNALSGPVERGDVQTIKKHIISFKRGKGSGNQKFNSILLNYLSQSLVILKAAEKKHHRLTESQLQIKKLLDDELKKLADNIR